MRIIKFLCIIAYHMCDFVYGLLLQIKGHKNVTEDELSQIKEIEASAYPNEIRGFEKIETVIDLRRHIGCSTTSQIDLYIFDGCYLLIVNHFNCVEIFDLAAVEGKCRNPLAIWKIISQQKRRIVALCRERTTYRMLKKLEKKGKIIIFKDTVKELWGEEFHSVKFRFIYDE